MEMVVVANRSRDVSLLYRRELIESNRNDNRTMEITDPNFADMNYFYGVIQFIRGEQVEERPFKVSDDNLRSYYLDYPKVYSNETKFHTLEEKELSEIIKEWFVNSQECPPDMWDRERVEFMTHSEWENKL